MSYELTETMDGLLIYTINRKEKRNAINYEIMESLKETLRIVKNSNYRAFVITGEGEQAFCSGGDLSVFHALRTESEAYEMLSEMARVLFELFMLPKPTIALMNGTAVGGGCELATACDFRFANENIRAGFVQGTLAITTGWGGATMLLERLEPTKALEMLMKAKIYGSEELRSLGFVDFTYNSDPMEGMRQGLDSFLTIEASVLTAYKQVVLNKRDRKRLMELVDKEVRQCAKLWEQEAHHRKVDEFLNRKKL